ncbi:kinase-like domain, phloem protein 2-like protein [Tanacetum coccineum]
MKGFEHLEIQLEDIKLATNNFNEENVIGHGGFGKVYKGELSQSHSKGSGMLAFKRLDRKHGQGDAEFYKEVRMLSCYSHDNIISLLGFSSGRDEMILVYEYASRGSLDSHLKDVNLKWTQRIKICLDAAKGLSYLHDPKDTYQRLIHCDIKSANILLDKNFNAKVADFGLSKIGPANPQNSVLVTDILGTHGYCDPVFMETYTLTKESDVYSFGVVLFEVFCGMLCFTYSNHHLKVHVPSWKKAYEDNKLKGIILKDLIRQMDPGSLKTFAGIAYQCLNKLREERPLMSLVVEKLESALNLQELYESKSLKGYQKMLTAADPPLKYNSMEELKAILSTGFLIKRDKTLLSITEKGEHIERIYIQACLNPVEIKDDGLQHLSDDIVNSRFPRGLCYEYRWDGFKARVRGQYLTPQISYTVNLVFRYSWQYEINSYSPLRYKLDGEEETKVFIIYPIHMRKDGWFIVPLYQFTSQHKPEDLQFEFENRATILHVAGIEFQPSEEKVELQVFEEYQYILEAASQSLNYRSLNELKQILSKGVHLNGYKTWFSLNEKGEHCHMISMEDCLTPNEDFPLRYKSHWFSRLREETPTATVYRPHPKKDNKLHMVELYQFTSDGSIVDLEISLANHGSNLQVEGILFQPLEKSVDPMIEDDKALYQKLDLESAHGDILRHGFFPGYTERIVHGEHNISLPPSQSTNVNVEETVFGQEDIRGDTTMEGDTEESTENGDHGDEGVSYKKLLEESHKEFRLQHDTRTFEDAFPHLTALPSSANEAKKFTKDLGLGYEKIHACLNDCMLY